MPDTVTKRNIRTSFREPASDHRSPSVTHTSNAESFSESRDLAGLYT